MSDVDAAPPAETDIGEDNSTLEAVIGRRHEPQQEHEAHREVGDDEGAALAALAAKAPAVAPKPEPTPAPAPAAPAAEAATDPTTDPKAPKWYRDHMAKTNRELAELRAQRPAPTAAPARPAAALAELPSPAEDPQGYHDAMVRRFSAQMQQFELVQSLRNSEWRTVQQHGREKFEECKAWLSTKPDIEAWAIQQPDQWEAAFTQYTRELLAEEIGDDPKAWQEKERQRIRDEVRAEMEGEGAPAAPARQPPQMRAAPPAPASTVRAVASRDEVGRFTGPAPLKTRNSFS